MNDNNRTEINMSNLISEVYIKDFDNITEGDECYIFLPPELKPTVLGTFSYYYPIAILDSTAYSISPIFDKNFISIEDYINNHLVK